MDEYEQFCDAVRFLISEGLIEHHYDPRHELYIIGKKMASVELVEELKLESKVVT